jgi:hypothetical protein
METWVNQVLSGPAKQHTTGLPNQQPLQPSSLSKRGLLNHGLSREELGAAGLGGDAIDRLYRALYVYSLGFFDTLQVGAGCYDERLHFHLSGAALRGLAK